MRFKHTNTTRYEIATEFNSQKNVHRVILYAINGHARLTYKIVEFPMLSDAVDYMMITYPEAKLARIITNA